MELERSIRSLEVAVALLWIASLYIRMRAVRTATSETWSQRLRSAVRPLHLATMGVLVLCIPLWIASSWQPLAHALTVPTVVAWGMVWAIQSVASKGSTLERVTASKPA